MAADHKTFEAYCKARWDFSRPRAYELINSARTVSAMADKSVPLPTSERQCRPLTKLPAEEQSKGWTVK